MPSRLRRLDDALADLPLDEPMLLTELDGFLTGIIVCPEMIPPAEWLQTVWGSDEGGVAPFEDPIDVQWFVDAVIAHQDGIVRDLNRGKPQPVFDIDDRNGDVLWELWIDGFAQAMALRPDSWAALAEGDVPDGAEALARLTMLIAVALNESPLDSMEINAIQDAAPALLIDAIRQVYATRARIGAAPPAALATGRPSKIGRNDPCRCGSGKKSKRCCG
ncbi:MAG TPA: UPF0149 family protein [Sphingomonas sp.]|jgi:uncharacterized protein|nr:UPF0149 family protein [Sphingomonas sp.]